MKLGSPLCRYLPVNKSPSRELFYTFVERREDAANSPLILWLQG